MGAKSATLGMWTSARFAPWGFVLALSLFKGFSFDAFSLFRNPSGDPFLGLPIGSGRRYCESDGQ